MGDKIGFIIVIIIALGIGLYLYSSGALVTGFNGFNSVLHFSTTSSSSTNTLFGSSSSTTSTAQATSSGGGWSFWSIFGPGNGGNVTGPQSSQSSSSQQTILTQGSDPSNSATPANPNLVNPQIPTGYTMQDLSPYFHEIRLGGVSAGNASYFGTIDLINDAYNTTGTIDVTGWQIKTQASGEYVPQAINIYDPSGLAPDSDIFMRNGDEVYMYSSSAPFNLRLNECSGYIAHVANFQPQLPMNCPYVDQSAIQNFTGECRNYIQTIGACQQPNMTSPQIPRNDYACQNYLENNFTYKSCFQAHAGDANFLSGQIWVWTGSNVVDQYHDTVKLLDRNGLLVDIYSF